MSDVTPGDSDEWTEGLPPGMTHEDYVADSEALRAQELMDEQDLLFAARSAEERPAGQWPECEFEGCTSPTSYRMRDRFGELHRACTAHQETLDLWVRIHNGWEEPVGAGQEGGEGTTEDGAG
jgi:hypothetical protein